MPACFHEGQTMTTKGGRWFKHIDFAILDVIMIIAAFVLSCYIRNGNLYALQTSVYRTILINLIIFTLFWDLATNILKNILKRGNFIELEKTIKLVTADIAALALYMFILKISVQFSRQIYLTTWVIGIVFVYVARVLKKKHLQTKLADRKNLSRLLYVTDNPDPGIGKNRLEGYAEHRFGIKAIALVGAGESANKDKYKTGETGELEMQLDGIPLLMGEDELFEYIRRHVVDEVFLGIEDLQLEKKILDELMLTGMTVHINLNRIFSDLVNPRVEEFAGAMVISTMARPISPVGLFIKRLMDIAGGIVGCIICGIAYIFVAPIIKHQSPGPVFFTQERVGLNGRRFKIYKFRSMYTDAEERLKDLLDQNKMQGLMFKMDDDPRITPIGKFIRKTSIDELPQFFNILKGEMSLVGTRPPTVREWEQYNLRHRARLAIKPGLTGLWQISGRSDITDFDDVVALDLKYIANWSIKEDIKIILKTIWVVFNERGAE